MKLSSQIANSENKVKVAVLGGSGIVGQTFVHFLGNHPIFELVVITGSDNRAGIRYGDDVQWKFPLPLPQRVADICLEKFDIDRLKEENIKIVFSALPKETALTIEPLLRDNHFYVFSNAGALRTEPDVPILIPEVNGEQLAWIERQGYPQKGFVVTNANCSTTGLATALAPLRSFGIKEVFVSTYQSISGAGYPGLSALDIQSNAIPYIQNEEEKMAWELQKILDAPISVFPTCVRVSVPYGHLETVWLTLEQDVEVDAVREAWETFTGDCGDLPTQPERPVIYQPQNNRPQPADSFAGTPAGMTVFTGRLRKLNGRIGFALLVNNIVKGAAGGSITNAELFLKKYFSTEA